MRNFFLRSFLKKTKTLLFELGFYIRNLKLSNKRYLDDEMFSIKYSETNIMMDYMACGKNDKENFQISSKKHSSTVFNKKNKEEIAKNSLDLNKRNSISKFK